MNLVYSPRLLDSFCLLCRALGCVFMLSACQTTPKAPDTPAQPKAAVEAKSLDAKSLEEIQKDLGMKRRHGDLGLAEKAFDPCPYGLAQSCTSKYFVVLQLQLHCRDSEGTVNEVPATLTPIANSNVQWSLGGQNGTVRTDRDGMANFILVSDAPVRGKRLIIKKGANYLGVSVSQASNLILPQDWCG